MEKNNRKNKKISIVLPVYNGERYIREAIESILGQTYDNLELIVVNDCSTDNTKSIVTEYSDKDNRIRMINNETNQKLPRSLNIGFASATGEYWTWTSDDNIYHLDALEKMVDIMNIHEDIDLVYSDYMQIDAEGNETGEVLLEDMDTPDSVGHVGACFLYKKDLAEKVGEYDPGFFLAEDYEFFIRCCEYGKVYHISENLYDYRKHEESLSGTRAKQIGIIATEVKLHHLKFILSKCKDQNERNSLCRSLIEWAYFNEYSLSEIRKRIYSCDSVFARTDRALRIKNKVNRIFGKS